MTVKRVSEAFPESLQMESTAAGSGGSKYGTIWFSIRRARSKSSTLVSFSRNASSECVKYQPAATKAPSAMKM